MALNDIYNYQRLSPLMATAGQPDEQQLHDVCHAGFQAVINLGLGKADYSVENEQTIIEGYGVQYFHIEVNFDAPDIENYYAFANLLKHLAGRKVFIHCAANKRASVFVALFQVIQQQLPLQQAMAAVLTIWEPTPAWNSFINSVLSNHQVSDVLPEASRATSLPG